MTDALPGIGPEPSAQEVVKRAFGEENRAKLLERYFSDKQQLSPGDAWLHTYRLLLWIDRTTGLAHCYESDKAQPGRPWYERSLAFHDWVSTQLETSPANLADEIDWLFREASADLAAAAAQAHRSERVKKQRAPYAGRGFPEPGSDPELVEIILDVLQSWLPVNPPGDVMHALTERIQAHVTKENKRKNLVGEGFEDTLAAILRRVPGIADSFEIRTRPLLHNLPGFHPPPANRKQRQVDLALIRKADKRRTLITAKWSVRSDREEQFVSDFADYNRYESLGQTFDYVLVTNEFDAARLVAACDVGRENASLFNRVVHVNPEGPKMIYGDQLRHSAATMAERIDGGRLESLEAWLTSLAL
jgi:hypothetical protein